MKIFKSHFWYHKGQRNGILLLLVVILLLQVFYFLVDFSSDDKIDVNSPSVLAFQRQIDSLRTITIKKETPKIRSFNPNYISDYKGEQLGMSLEEIDKLLAFRAKNKFINSVKEFQEITNVSDSLLNTIAPYFKFPDWVEKKNQSKNKRRATSNYSISKNITIKDINKATANDLKKIKGIGNTLATRIIKYRSKLKGFSYPSQIHEVWGLQKDIAEKVVKTFLIIEKPVIKKRNVNTVSFKELLKNPYIDYNLCKQILEYRDQVAELQNISELKNIEGFPVELYDRIVLYLLAE